MERLVVFDHRVVGDPRFILDRVSVVREV